MKRDELMVGMFIGLFFVALCDIFLGVAESVSRKMYNDMWNDTVNGLNGFCV